MRNLWQSFMRHDASSSLSAIPGLFVMAMLSCVSNAYAEETKMIDCPLRDEPYSIESPLMDILLNDRAVEIVNRHMNGVLDRMPAHFVSKTSPSFSAIINVKMVTSMSRIDKSILPTIDQELAALPITDADKQARCARYDVEVPAIAIPEGKPKLLLFEKINGFRDAPSVTAAAAALRDMAKRNGWALVATDKAGAFTPEILKQFDAVIWNNISGDVLTVTQRKVFTDYIDNGGGFVGIHGAGGDPSYFWDWYVDELIGARFIGHPMDPEYQDARVIVENTDSGIGRGLPATWTLHEEWYSFKSSPRLKGATIIATLDEPSYSPVGHGGQNLRMGDHPIAWSRCVNNGRSFYSAIGHLPEVYTEANHVKLLEQGIVWAAGNGETHCRNDAETKR